jgi:hypothetical protein
VREQGEGREKEINLCITDERETPRRVREHLDMSTFGLVTGGGAVWLKRAVRGLTHIYGQASVTFH